MQDNNRTNRIVAFIIFVITSIVYLKTVAPTTSFWDCGEFITSAYIMGIPHPPGAPLYLLVGRFFSMIPFAADIGLRVNIISSFSSSITAMLTYLIIVRLIVMFRGTPRETVDKIIVYSSGIIGSLTLAFSDSFWFNSVEAEVYSISMFFTAFVVWLILVWYEKADESSSDKYIILIAYAIGLVIGVHLLSILALPALFLLVYFRKTKKIEWNSFAVFTLISGLIFIAIYPGIVKKVPNFILYLNNTTGPGFTLVFLLIVLGALLFSMKSAIDNKRRYIFLGLASLIVILIGVSTYATIYIRSGLNPDLDENDPENMTNMVSYLNREQYGEWSIVERRAPFWEYQIKKMYVRYFGWQFLGTGQTLGEDSRVVETLSPFGLFMIPFLFGIIGMFYHFVKDWRHGSFIMILFLATGLAIAVYLNQEDPQPRERDYVYTGSFMAFAIWIGIGAYALLDYFKTLSQKYREKPQQLLILVTALTLLFIMPINMFAFHYHSHNRTGNYVAHDYSYNILQSCEPNAILFTNGDNDTFPLWYLQYVENIRKDVRVVNLSLLNTHWYIKQLRDQEPKVPISLNNNQIDALEPRLWEEPKTVKFDVPKDAYLRDVGDIFEKRKLMEDVEKPPQITFKLKPTLYNRGIRVQDMMILNIIQSNRFRRPIYFALTVSNENQINMNEYLRMDGLVYKLVTYPGEKISPAHLKNNLLTNFRYRNLNSTDVYYNENIKGLLRNYQGAFYSLTRFYQEEKMYDDMVEVLDHLFTSLPDTVIPMRHELAYQFARMYRDAGASDKAESLLDRIINRDDVSMDHRLQYIYFFYPEEKESKAIARIEELIKQYPDYSNGIYWMANYHLKEKQYDKGLSLLTGWLDKHPDDKTANSLKNQLERMLGQSRPDTNALNIPAPELEPGK